MERRITSKSVVFRKAFALSGLDGIQPPGSYIVRTEEEMLDTISFIGWRQIGTTLELHRDGGVEYAAVDVQELREVLVKDGDQGTDPPAAPSQAAVGDRRVRDHRGARQ